MNGVVARRSAAVRRALRGQGPVTAIVVVAVVARLSIVLLSAGFGGITGYDPGVYYAAADALLGGRLPYRDFTLLHPPGIALFLAPFAALGRLTTDHVGFVVAALAMVAVGAANATLVFAVSRRLGFPVRGALVGGLFYAVTYASLGSEYAPRLEPVGNLFTLLGLLAFISSRHGQRPWLVMLGGAALGAAASVKIWYVVPLAVVLLWGIVQRRGLRHLALMATGVALALAVIDLPFFAAAPSAMWHSVVVDQVGRQRAPTTVDVRVSEIVGVGLLPASLSTLHTVVVGMSALILLAVAIAARHRNGRLPALLFLSEVVTLLVAPSSFAFYADYAATGLALVVAAASTPSVSPAAWRTWIRISVPLAVLLSTALATASIDVIRPVQYLTPFPAQRLRPVVSGARCVQANQPAALIDLDVLSRDIHNGCPQWVDVTGRTYGVDLRRGPHGVPIPRSANRVWQRDLSHYLLAGQDVVITQPEQTGLSAQTLRRLRRGGLRASEAGVQIYATRRTDHARARTVTARRSQPVRGDRDARSGRHRRASRRRMRRGPARL